MLKDRKEVVDCLRDSNLNILKKAVDIDGLLLDFSSGPYFWLDAVNDGFSFIPFL